MAAFVTNSGTQPHHAKPNAQRHLLFVSVSGEREGQEEVETAHDAAGFGSGYVVTEVSEVCGNFFVPMDIEYT